MTPFDNTVFLLPCRSMRPCRLLYGLLFVVVAVGCGSAKVGYDYDRSVDFSRYHTYGWAGAQQTTGDRRLQSSLVDARIRTAIDAELRAKGYTVTANGQPEFWVAYQVGMKDMIKGASTQNYIGDRVHGTYTTISDIQSYKEGTLLIDIADASSQTLVWQASAHAEVDQSLGPKERDERIGTIVRAMLAHFPPQ
jgi:Domain of unknown function (DUF4136)